MPIHTEREKSKQPGSPKDKAASPWNSIGWALRSMSEGRPLGKALCCFPLPPAGTSHGDGRRPDPAPVIPTHGAALSNPRAAKSVSLGAAWVTVHPPPLPSETCQVTPPTPRQRQLPPNLGLGHIWGVWGKREQEAMWTSTSQLLGLSSL